MAKVEIPYRPRPEQQLEHDRLVRFNVLVCHRRWGKTYFAINQLIRDVISCPLENARGAYVAPLLKQAKAIAWDYLNADTNNWFMADSVLRRQSTYWVDRVPVEFAFAEDLDTIVAKWRGYMRYSNSHRDWRWVLGAQVS